VRSLSMKQSDGGNKKSGGDANRAAHLAELTRKIQDWRADLIRLEEKGRKAQAANIRTWIKSAERVAHLLKRAPNAEES